MAVEKIYTPTELNRFTKDVEEKVRAVKCGYPIHISATDGKTGRPTSGMLRLTKIGEDKIIDHEVKGEVKEKINGKETIKTDTVFAFKGRLGTYEYIDPETGEVRREKYPIFPKGDLSELYKFAADLAEYSEAFRRFTTLQTACHPDVARTGLPGTGIPLADRLTGTAGVSYIVEQVLDEEYKKRGFTGSSNNYIRSHEDQRVVTELKDKYWKALVDQYVTACRTIASALKEVTKVEVLNLASTGVVPTVVSAPKINITETTDMVTKPKDNGFGNSDLFKTDFYSQQFK